MLRKEERGVGASTLQADVEKANHREEQLVLFDFVHRLLSCESEDET